MRLLAKIPEALRLKDQSGRMGWVLLWALGVPIPVLIILYLIRGGT